MRLIVGLGNIGKQYEHTRHNIGFMVADELARRWGAGPWKEDKNALYVEYRAPEKVFLIKPTTYMNNSGLAVGNYARFYNIAPEDIVVIQDDMDMACGQTRIRHKGSSGGHNGIRSTAEHLGTDQFLRFKIGIGHPVHEQQVVVDHVLHPFVGEQKELIEKAVLEMADAVELWLKVDLDEVMQRYNKKAPKQKPAAEAAVKPKAKPETKPEIKPEIKPETKPAVMTDVMPERNLGTAVATDQVVKAGLK